MKLFKKYYLNIKDINISHIVFSLLFLITLIGCALLNKVFSSPNLYGSEIFHSDTAFKNQILLIAIFFIFYLIFNIRKSSDSLIKTLLYCSTIILFFPFQTTGSFFSTFNGLFYFLVAAINNFVAKYYKLSK